MGNMGTPMGPPPQPFAGPTADKMRDRLGQRGDSSQITSSAVHRAGENIMRRLHPPPQPMGPPGAFSLPPTAGHAASQAAEIARLNAEVARLRQLAAQLEWARAKAAGEFGGMSAHRLDSTNASPWYDPMGFGKMNIMARLRGLNPFPMNGGIGDKDALPLR